MPSTSGSSDEIISTATPWAASSESSRCTSALVPTSMPRVGSSTISSRGLRASHFASTTFCWLPPESVQTGLVSLPYLSCRRSAQSRANRRSAPCGISPPRLTWSSDASAMLRSIEKSITSPCWRRSSGTSAIPASIAAVGDADGSRLPSISTEPASRRSIPKIARATSVRPAPTRPARATISPLRTSNDTSVKTPSRVSRSTFRTVRPASAGTFGNSASMSRPTIARITDGIVSSPIGLVRTWRPSRITVTRGRSRRSPPAGARRTAPRSRAHAASRRCRTAGRPRCWSGRRSARPSRSRARWWSAP